MLSIIIPALNEAEGLQRSVAAASGAARAADLTYEIVIIDDGSTDSTGETADRLAVELPHVRAIHNPRNLGLGASYRIGVAAAKGRYVTWVPGDDSHPVEGLLPAYRAIGKADIILPVPTNPEVRHWSRRLVSAIYTLVLNFLFGYAIPYYNGLSIHRTELLRQLEITTSSFAFQAEIILKLLSQGRTWLPCPVPIAERNNGPTKAFKPRNIVGVLLTVIRLARSVNFSRSIDDSSTLRATSIAALGYTFLLLAVYANVLIFGYSLEPTLLQPAGVQAMQPRTEFERLPINTFNLDLADPAYTMWPLNRLVGSMYAAGELPLWNPYQGAGEPLAAQYSTRAFFPYQILANLFPHAGDMFLLGRLFVAGLLTFLLLRNLRLSFLAAFVGGMSYMLSGAFIWFIWLEQMLNVAMVLPLYLLACYRLLATPSGIWLSVVAISIALVLLAGQPETALYVLTFGGILFLYGLLEFSHKWQMRIVAFAAAAILGFAMAAPLLLPFVELVLNGTHLHPPGGNSGTKDLLPWSWLAAVFFPTLYSLPRPAPPIPLNGLWDYIGTYIGMTGAVVLVAGLILSERPYRRWFMFFVATAIFFQLKHLGIRPFIWIGHLPFFDQAWSQRWASPVAAFGFAGALGYAIHAIQQFSTRMNIADLQQKSANQWPPAIKAMFFLPIFPIGVLARSDVNLSPVIGQHLVVLALFLATVSVFSLRRRNLPDLARSKGNLGRLNLRWAGTVAAGGATALALWVGEMAKPTNIYTALRYDLLLVAAALPGIIWGVLLILAPNAIERSLARWNQLQLGLVLILIFTITLLFVALSGFPPILNEQQWPYTKVHTLIGSGISLLNGLVAATMLWRQGTSRNLPLALAILLFGELTFVVPRGLSSEAALLMAIPAFLCILAAILLYWKHVRSAAVAATAAVFLVTAIDLGSSNGFPKHRDAFALPDPLVQIRSEDPYARITGAGGLLFPTFASAYKLQDVHYIASVAVQWFYNFAETQLQEIKQARGVDLWFTGIPFRNFEDLDPARSVWYRDYAFQYADASYPIEMATERAKFDWTSKWKQYSFLGVKYFLLPGATVFSPTGPDGSPLARLVHDGHFRIFENLHAQPRAFVVHSLEIAADWQQAQERFSHQSFNPRQKAIVENSPATMMRHDQIVRGESIAKIVEYRANAVEIHAQLHQPGLLVLTDTYFPGWVAEVNGRKVDVVRVNGLVRGVFLEEGASAVRFYYRPRAFYFGCLIGGIGLAGAFAVAIAWRRSILS